MKVFFGNAVGWADVAADSPTEASLESALEVFRKLDAGRGFIGIEVTARLLLQLLVNKDGTVRVELLDPTVPALESCTADCAFAESLVCAVGEGRDVLELAHEGDRSWEPMNLAD